MIKCLECTIDDEFQYGIKELVGRGLCMRHYQRANRAGTLDEYPTQLLINDPDSLIRSAFKFYAGNIGDIAVEFGYRLERN